MTPPAAKHPLDGPRGKLVRAIQQARALVDYCSAYVDSQPMQLVAQFASGTHVVYLEGRPPPLYLGLLLGEIVHDLRSGLDQLAWQLALDYTDAGELERPNVRSAITFPITSSRSAFKAHRAIPYFDDAVIDQMEELQPYHNDESPLVNPLALVQDLSNADKHRVLVPSLAEIPIDDLMFWTDTEIDRELIQFHPHDDSIIDPTRPLFSIPAPESARIELSRVPVRVCFMTFVTGSPSLLSPDHIGKLCLQTAEATGRFETFFREIDWSERTESWTTPDLPS